MYSIVSNKAKASTSRLRTTAALLPLLSLLLVLKVNVLVQQLLNR